QFIGWGCNVTRAGPTKGEGTGHMTVPGGGGRCIRNAGRTTTGSITPVLKSVSSALGVFGLHHFPGGQLPDALAAGLPGVGPLPCVQDEGGPRPVGEGR